MHSAEGGNMFINAIQQWAIAVEQFARRSVFKTLRLASVVSLACGGRFFMLEEITSDH